MPSWSKSTVSPEALKRYSPAECVGCKRENVTGSPDPEHISTGYIERANFTMRMSMRRFTRMTNGFSKDVENHRHALAIHFMHYNFARIHQTCASARPWPLASPASCRSWATSWR